MLPGRLSAQENFLTGFIVNLSGDTVHGEIDYRGWDVSPSSVNFRKGARNIKQAFSSGDIRAFGVQTKKGPEVYRAFMVRLINNSHDLSKLSNHPQPTWDQTQIFLQLLEDGALSLYKYKRADARIHFFISKGADLPAELIFHTYADYNNALYYNREYRQQLQAATADCPDMKSSGTDGLEYHEKAITKLVSRYNTCKVEKSYSFRNERNPVHISLTAGANYARFRTEGLPPYDIMDYKGSFGASVGATFQFVLPRQNEKLSILIEPVLRLQEHTGKATRYENENDYSNFTHEIKTSFIRITTLFRYEFVKNPLRPFIQLGIANAFSLSLKNTLKEHRVFYTTISDLASTSPAFTRQYEQGLVLGTGFSFARSSLEGRFELSNGISKAVLVTSRMNTFSVLYSYKL
jgi:hypothetical protein